MEQLRELGAFGIKDCFYLLIFYGKHGRKILTVSGLWFLVYSSLNRAVFIARDLLKL